ncbi:MAG: InlB B-repeat-containing protein [Candidatus Coproplasma sp.]
MRTFKGNNRRKRLGLLGMVATLSIALFAGIGVATITTNNQETLSAEAARPYNGTLSTGSSYYVCLCSGNDARRYSFTPSTTGIYRLYSYSIQRGDPFAYICKGAYSDYYPDWCSYYCDVNACQNSDSARYALAYDDDGYGDHNFSICYFMEAGNTYTYVLTSYKNESTDYYVKFQWVGYYGNTLDRQGGSGGNSYIYGGGVSGYPTKNTASYTSSATSSSKYISTPTRTGYIFGGYYTGTSGTGTQVIQSNGYINNVSFTGAQTFYAKWTPITYKIRYYGNGGTFAGNSGSSYWDKTFYYDTSYIYLNSLPTRTGYTFKGWSTSSSATTADYQAGDSFKNLTTTNGATISLYAVWEANNYKVNFDTNNGVGEFTPVDCTYNTTTWIDVPTPTKHGYSFKGWATTIDGTEDILGSGYRPIINLSTDEDVTLYAIWEALNYEVKVDLSYTVKTASGDETRGSVTDTNISYNTQVSTIKDTLPALASAQRVGYDFEGLYYDANDNGVKDEGELWYDKDLTAQDITWLPEEDLDSITLLPVWTPHTYTITLNFEDADSETTQTQEFVVNYGSAIELPLPTKEGYLFNGWKITGANGDTVYYSYNPPYNELDEEEKTVTFVEMAAANNGAGATTYQLYNATPDDGGYLHRNLQRF